MLPNDREVINELLNASGYVDLVIPRGSKSLIDFVRQNAKVPVIETGAGVCHTYFDRSGDIEKGRAIVFNAKTRRVSVCNALDCLIMHRSRLSDLPDLCAPLAEKNVVLYADDFAYAILDRRYPASLLRQADAHSFGTEFLDYKMAIKTVSSIDEALEHIARYSSQHSESIVSEDARGVRSVYSGGRCRLCIYQCIDGVYRRRTVRVRSGDRHQYAKAACTRAYGFARAYQL